MSAVNRSPQHPHASDLIRLPADLGIEQAESLQHELLSRVSSPQPQLFDAAEVTRIHTAALQLFCMFCQDRRNAGYETHWRHPSESLRSAAALLGVTTLLQLAREPA